jgi:hypothetical protein
MEVEQLIINYERILEDKKLFLEMYKELSSVDVKRLSAEMRIFRMIIKDLKNIK